jgi:phage FluMu protein Com
MYARTGLSVARRHPGRTARNRPLEVAMTMTDEDSSHNPQEGQAFEVKCPECKTKVRVTTVQAERDMKVKCPKGHEVPLAKAF